MASEIYPVFQVRALFLNYEVLVPLIPGGKTKVRLDFAVDSINKNGQKRSHISADLAAQIGAFLSVKVEPSTYDLIKHLLKENAELALTVCPLPWKVENGSGMFYDFIEVEKFGLGNLE